MPFHIFFYTRDSAHTVLCFTPTESFVVQLCLSPQKNGLHCVERDVVHSNSLNKHISVATVHLDLAFSFLPVFDCIVICQCGYN